MNAKKVFQIIILSFFGGIFLIPFAPGIFVLVLSALVMSICGYTLMYQREACSICISLLIGAILSIGVYGYHTHQTNTYFQRISELPSSNASYDFYIESYQKRAKQ